MEGEKIKAKERSLKDTAIIWMICCLFLIQPAMQGKSGMLASLTQKADELVTALAVVVLLYHLILDLRISRLELWILGSFLLFLIMGAVSTWSAEIQPWRYAFEDILSSGKFVIPFAAVRVLKRRLHETVILERVQKTAAVFIRLLFGMALLDMLLPGGLFGKGDYRYLMYSVKLFYFHPSVLAQTGVFCMAVFSIPSKKRWTKELCMAAFLVIITLRMRAVGFVFLYACMRAGPYLWGKRGKYAVSLAGAAGALLIGFDSFSEYYLQAGTSARSLLTINGGRIAAHFWPLGSGFATYGTAAAASHYSPVYKALGYPKRYGLSPGNPQYLMDTFWPGIAAQYGCIGMGLFILLLCLMAWDVAGLYRAARSYTAAAVTLIGYLVVSTIGSSSFFHPIAVVYGMTFGLILSAGFKEGARTTHEERTKADTEYLDTGTGNSRS